MKHNEKKEKSLFIFITDVIVDDVCSTSQLWHQFITFLLNVRLWLNYIWITFIISRQTLALRKRVLKVNMKISVSITRTYYSFFFSMRWFSMHKSNINTINKNNMNVSWLKSFKEFIEIHVKNFQNLKDKRKKRNFQKISWAIFQCAYVSFAQKFIKIFSNLCSKRKEFSMQFRIRKACFLCKIRIAMFQSRKSWCQHQNSNDEMHFRFHRNVDANFFIVIIWNIVDCKNNESITSRNCLSTIFFSLFSFSFHISFITAFFA